MLQKLVYHTGIVSAFSILTLEVPFLRVTVCASSQYCCLKSLPPRPQQFLSCTTPPAEHLQMYHSGNQHYMWLKAFQSNNYTLQHLSWINLRRCNFLDVNWHKQALQKNTLKAPTFCITRRSAPRADTCNDEQNETPY